MRGVISWGGAGGCKSLGGMDPDTSASSNVIHVVVMEIPLWTYLWETLVVPQVLIMMRWGDFHMSGSLTC